ncbi:hypothetical protein ACH436_18755 [Isoptericola sp. NPDC019693]|uniref:hypothetical protein n=1 Tax=Isoptericola sp. NPDC019693 TaxID=3364009 RepID=UPI0037A768BB
MRSTIERVRAAVRRRPAGRALLAGGLALSVAAGVAGGVALGVGGAGPRATDAAWASQEAGAVSATAGTVAVPATTCEGHNNSPNLLKLAPGDDGLEVTGYRVVMSVDESAHGVPDAWQTGTTSDGAPLLPANATTDVPAGTTAVAWGVSSGLNYTITGTVTVRALGPGGWTSEPVVYTWSVGFDWLGIGYGSCTPA